jgi:hypothetical protein
MAAAETALNWLCNLSHRDNSDAAFNGRWRPRPLLVEPAEKLHQDLEVADWGSRRPERDDHVKRPTRPEGGGRLNDRRMVSSTLRSER